MCKSCNKKIIKKKQSVNNTQCFNFTPNAWLLTQLRLALLVAQVRVTLTSLGYEPKILLLDHRAILLC